MKRRRIRSAILAAVGLCALVIAIAGVVAATGRARVTAADGEIPLAVVKRGDLSFDVHAVGELGPSQKAMLTAPTVGGDTLQITQLLHTGSRVNKGDIVMEFDPSQQRYKQEESQSELEEAEQEIVKAQADAEVLAAKDKVDLLTARYAVRRAELDLQTKEVSSKIDGEKFDLALDEARQELAELEKNMQSHAADGDAAIFLARENYNKAKLGVDEANENLAKMHVTAPMAGLVSVQKNMGAVGGFAFAGMAVPDYRPGDQVDPGTMVAQVVDPATMELVAKVGEGNRSNVKTGQSAEVRFDAIPGQVFSATVKSVAGAAARPGWWDPGAQGTFDVTLQLSAPDARLRPGFTAQALLLGEKRRNVLYLPPQALFLKDGKRIVYVAESGGYSQREVVIQNESEGHAAIEGLKEGASVALVDPTAPSKSAPRSSTAGVGGTL